MLENIGLPIVISIAALAAVDSINPVEFLAGIFLFTIKKPLKSFFSYTTGIFVFHFLLGFALYYIFNYILNLKIFDSPVFDRSIELIGGVLLIILGLRMKKRNESTVRRSFNVKPLYTFLLGIGITISAIPTSAAYYSALGIIANNNLTFGNLAFLLLLYNLIFILPLFILLAVYILFRKYSENIFEKIRVFIAHRLNRLLRVILILAGLFLIIDVFLYVTG